MAPRWMSLILWAAAAYNVIWGSWVILRPLDLFRWTGGDPPNYLAIWQCLGMVVGVHGVGFAIAATAPFRHWPVILVALLGKLMGPIGFAWMFLTTASDDAGRLPLAWGWMLITNDLIWWLPFSVILYQAARHHLAPGPVDLLTIDQANQQFADQNGRTIDRLCHHQTCLVVFLRHSGCTFCRQTLADLRNQRAKLAAEGVLPILVHMGDEVSGQQFFAEFELDDVPRISDPHCQLYRAYGLNRGRLGQLLGPTVWWRGFKAAILSRHGVGPADGDGFQMPGAFLISDGKIIREFRHQTAADRPDYCQLASGVVRNHSPLPPQTT
jgi:peroxiredoxin